jgi:23S rRNA (cytidine1920-2'-O)/16S rRNA (cytidine1409-2'-O)-methyltransferase
VRRQLVTSRAEAQQAIDAGLVTVDGAPAFKAATQVRPDQAVALAHPPRRFVSRGGEKLDHALATFAVEVAGRDCLDAGMSTGGFTDCLLQRGAASVVGYDVGYGQVHERLRTDPRVTVVERTNIRDVRPADVPPPPRTLVVCDVSFIALRMLLPALRALATADAELVALVKPQFEAERGEVGKGGVVRDAQVWQRVLAAVVDAGRALDWGLAGVTVSPLLGPAGNVEFLIHLTPRAAAVDAMAAIAAAVAAGERLRAR